MYIHTHDLHNWELEFFDIFCCNIGAVSKKLLIWYLVAKINLSWYNFFFCRCLCHFHRQPIHIVLHHPKQPYANLTWISSSSICKVLLSYHPLLNRQNIGPKRNRSWIKLSYHCNIIFCWFAKKVSIIYYQNFSL